MICIQLKGGLGNQMFQYACGRALAIKHDTDLVFDLRCLSLKSEISHHTSRQVGLQVFRLNLEKVRKRDLLNFKHFAHRLLNIFYLHFNSKGIQTSNFFVEREFSYNAAIENVSNNCFLVGYWQSPLYFQSIDFLIREDFKFPRLVDNKNINYLKLIESRNSVSLHIRRTDFINNSNHNVHGVCPLEYYHKAVTLISNMIDNPVFFVFSDDIAWAKQNIKFNFDIEFVSGNSDEKGYIDMLLMSSCKHNIIANSSFSWWAAWLNSNKSKIVITPAIWFLDKKLNAQTNDLIPEEWIRI